MSHTSEGVRAFNAHEAQRLRKRTVTADASGFEVHVVSYSPDFIVDVFTTGGDVLGTAVKLDLRAGADDDAIRAHVTRWLTGEWPEPDR